TAHSLRFMLPPFYDHIACKIIVTPVCWVRLAIYHSFDPCLIKRSHTDAAWLMGDVNRRAFRFNPISSRLQEAVHLGMNRTA
ncbi:MAG: hypothetical protein WC145_13365, partial [Aliarcobacter sp.]